MFIGHDKTLSSLFLTFSVNGGMWMFKMWTQESDQHESSSIIDQLGKFGVAT